MQLPQRERIQKGEEREWAEGSPQPTRKKTTKEGGAFILKALEAAAKKDINQHHCPVQLLHDRHSCKEQIFFKRARFEQHNTSFLI